LNKNVEIMVNGRTATWNDGFISYEEVAILAGKKLLKDLVYTITFHRGPVVNQQGILTPGNVVQVVPEMVFNVHVTDKA
jgi:hypothetical protein